jgi:arylsulfatase A-like enzyme
LVAKYERKARTLHLDEVEPESEGEFFPCLHKSDKRVRRRLLQSHATYAAMMENMDTNIGRVLAALRDEGIEEETVVCFTSDNGGLSTAEGSPTCNLPRREGKGWAFEGGTRVCQIIRWPETVRPGSRCRVPVTSTDFYPTLLEAAGLPPDPEQHCDGASLLPLLREDGPNALAASPIGARDALYWHYPHYGNQGGTPAASVVSGGWKLLRDYETGADFLYDLENDIGETRDVAADHPGTVARLAQLLTDWQKEVEAKIPQANPDYPEGLKRPAVPNNACD